MAQYREQSYDIAIDGQGFILARDPKDPIIRAAQDTVFGNRFASGDRSYTDFSQWWFWAQTSFLRGIKEEGEWEDDAQYLEGENIDALSVSGEIKLLRRQIQQATTLSNTAKITVGTFGQTAKPDGSSVETAFYIGTEATSQAGGTFTFVFKSTDGGNNWTSAIAHNNNSNAVTRFYDLFFATPASGGGESFLIAIAANRVYKYLLNGGTSTATDISSNVGTANYSAGVYYKDELYIWTKESEGSVLRKSSDFFATAGSDVITYRGGARIRDAIVFNNKIYYFIHGGTFDVGAELRSYDGTSDVLVHKFEGVMSHSFITSAGVRRNRSMAILNNTLIIFFIDNSIWTIDTSNNISKIFKGVNWSAPQGSMAVSFGNQVEFGNLILEDIGGEIAIHNKYNQQVDSLSVPIAANGTTHLYVRATDALNPENIFRFTGGYVDEGYFKTNVFNEISGIDKLFYSVTLTFKTLATEESIDVEYSTDEGTTFTSLGSIDETIDGAVSSKTFYFGDAVVSKKLMLKVTLNNGSGNSTPTFYDYSVAYLPMPDYRLNWKFTVKCQDQMSRKDGTIESKSALWLRNLLRNSWWTKSILSFEDYDASADERLNGVLSASATTIPVKGVTDNFPERGRILLDSEEVFYNGKNKSEFLNCTRGARGTNATTHADNSTISTAHRVIITNYQEQLILANKPNDAEYLVTLELREV